MIKFRGKDRLGKWVYGCAVTHPLGKAYIIQYKHTTPMWIEANLHTVGQFTGTCDRNSKPIYVGDIVEWSETIAGDSKRVHRAEVIMFRGGFTPISECIRHIGFMSTDMEVSKFDCVVLGNVHDNPQLLENF